MRSLGKIRMNPYRRTPQTSAKNKLTVKFNTTAGKRNKYKSRMLGVLDPLGGQETHNTRVLLLLRGTIVNTR